MIKNNHHIMCKSSKIKVDPFKKNALKVILILGNSNPIFGKESNCTEGPRGICNFQTTKSNADLFMKVDGNVSCRCTRPPSYKILKCLI